VELNIIAMTPDVILLLFISFRVSMNMYAPEQIIPTKPKGIA